MAKPDLQPLVPTCTLDHHRDVILDNLSYRLWTIDINIVQGAAKWYTFTMLVATEISEISQCLEKANKNLLRHDAKWAFKHGEYT